MFLAVKSYVFVRMSMEYEWPYFYNVRLYYVWSLCPVVKFCFLLWMPMWELTSPYTDRTSGIHFSATEWIITISVFGMINSPIWKKRMSSRKMSFVSFLLLSILPVKVVIMRYLSFNIINQIFLSVWSTHACDHSHRWLFLLP